MKPLVSILIPCYNAAPWLAETLESALAQTWENKEIILVDDGSTDESLAIAQSFEPQGIKVISQPNQGASAARNRALQEAQGDFIQYLDADDLLAPNKIECQLQHLNKEDDFIISGEWTRFLQSPLEANFIPEPVWGDMLPVDWLICSYNGGGMMHPAAWLTPRHIAQLAGCWDESLSTNDDGEYFCRVVLASKGVRFCSGAKVYYRSRLPGSLSSKRTIEGITSTYQSLELCTNHLLSKEDSIRVRGACATLFQRFIYFAYPDTPALIEQAEAKVVSLGGSELEPGGGHLFHTARKMVGWKMARRLQKIYSVKSRLSTL